MAGVTSAAPCLELAMLDGSDQVATPLTAVSVIAQFVEARLRKRNKALEDGSVVLIECVHFLR